MGAGRRRIRRVARSYVAVAAALVSGCGGGHGHAQPRMPNTTGIRVTATRRLDDRLQEVTLRTAALAETDARARSAACGLPRRSATALPRAVPAARRGRRRAGVDAVRRRRGD